MVSAQSVLAVSSSLTPRFAFIAALACACACAAAGCHPAKPPELTVIGSSAADTHAEVVFVQVTNPAKHSMRLTKLEYSFAADGGATVSQGELELSRDVPAGA